MTLDAITFDTIADGTPITTANAFGFSTVSPGTGTSMLVKSAAAMDGARGVEITAGAAATHTLRKSFSANPVAAISVAFKLITNSTVTNMRTVGARYASGFSLSLMWNPAATQLYVNDGGGTSVGTAYTTAALNTAYRVEFVANVGSSTATGNATVNLYTLAGTTPVKTWTVANGNLQGPNALTAVDITVSNGGVVQFDSIQTDDGRTTEIGRYTPPASVPPVATITTTNIYQVAGSNVSLSGTLTDADGTIASAQWQYMDDDENGLFTGSWTNLTTSTTGAGTASATATATDTSVPVGVRRYQLTGVDNLGASATPATVDGYIYPTSAAVVPVRYVINTGSYSNAGTAPASSLVAALNDTSPNSGFNSWAESPAAPVGAVLTAVFEPHGPGPITITLDLQVDTASPNVTVTPTVKNLAGGTTVYAGAAITPTTTAQSYSLVLDAPGNAAATEAIRKTLRLDLSATQ